MSDRNGFTLIEVVVALTLLGVVLMGIGASSAQLTQASTNAVRATAALDLLHERMATVRMDPAYDQIEARYEGTETSIAGFPGLTRKTEVTATRDSLPSSGGILAYKLVTVTVDGTGLEKPLTRTIAVAPR